MKFALIGAAALVTAASVTPALAQAVIEDPGYCAQFTRTQIVKTWDLAIRTPMEATIVAARRAATRQRKVMLNITIRRTADNGKGSGLAAASFCRA
jgi:hypothetical protein